MSEQSGNISRQKARQLFAVGVVVPVTVAALATVGVAVMLETQEQQRARDVFQTRVQNVSNGLEENLIFAEEMVYSLAALLTIEPNLSEARFRDFAERNLRVFPGVQALEWAPQVAAADRQEFERRLQSSGHPEFRIRRYNATRNRWVAEAAAWSDHFFPVTYIHPLKGNEAALGIDMTSHPERNSAIRHARDERQGVSTAPIELVQRQDQRTGFLFLVPAFASRATDAPVTGVAVGVFHVQSVVEAVFRSRNVDGILLQITDVDQGGGQLYESSGFARNAAESFQERTETAVGGRRWQLDWRLSRGYLAEKRSGKGLQALFIGLVGTTLLGMLMWSNHTYAARTEAQVEQRTAALREAQSRLLLSQYTIDSALDSIFWIRQDGSFSYVNDAAAARLGYSPEQLLNLTVSDITPSFTSKKWADFWERSLKEPEQTFETVHRRSDGMSYHCEVQTSLMTYSGRTLIVASSRDITERRQMNEVLRRHKFTIDHSAEAIYWVDESGRFRYVNSTAAKMLGYSIEELLRLRVQDVDPDYPPDVWAAHWQRVKRDQSIRLVTRHLDADGNPHDVEMDIYYYEFQNDSFIVGVGRDITERIRTQRRLEMTQEAIETAADAVIWLNSDGHLIYANEVTSKWLQYSRDELLSMTVMQITPDMQDAVDFRTRMWPDGRRESPAVLEMTQRRKDGSVFPVEVATHLIHFGDDVFACSIVRDVTEKKRVARVLEQTRERLRLAVHGGNVGLWDWDIRTGAVNYSAEWHRQLGVRPHTLSKFSDWEARVHPDDVKEAMQRIEQVVQKREREYESTFRMMHEDFSYRWILSRGRLYLDKDGQPVRMVGSHVDITELQDVRQRLEAYLQLLGTTDGSWDWEFETDYVEYSPRFRELLGFDRDDLEAFPNTVTSVADRIHPDDRRPVRRRILQHLRDGRPVELEFRIRRRDNEYRWFRGRGDTIRTRDGKPLRMAGSLYDVTEQKVTQIRLAESNADLEQYAYVASHDLQEPLRAVGGFCQLLEKRYTEVLDDTGRSYIEKVVSGVARMKNLIEDLLEFSRIGRQDGTPEKVDLNECVERALRNLVQQVEDSGARIYVDSLPTVLGRGNLLTQLFQNLISNAMKFVPVDTVPEVRVTADRQQTEWVITIADNGLGIEAKHQEQIFTIFKRLHHREHIPGTGIGLAICKRIVDRHGGRIFVDSEPGQGSSFSFTLPTSWERSRNQ
ncbi:MAG: hypothetical protein Fues2KO_39800 [Fuerstiella sp.]